MISDSERREVAAKLRVVADLMGYMRQSAAQEVVDMDTVMTILLGRRVFVTEPIAYVYEVRKLADLIDRPTCRNVYDEDRLGACANGFECSECHGVVEDCEGYRVTGAFVFCPRCGAEVVE